MDDFELDFSKSNGFYVNCEKVSTDKDLLPVTRNLAKKLMETEYLTVGEFFENINDVDLNILLHGSEMTDDNPNMLDDIMVLSMLLCGAEGANAVKDENDVMTIVSQFTSFVALESLFRKGLIKLHRENMSFVNDLGNKIIAERAF